MERQTECGGRQGRFRPELAFYHPNAKGTGCAVKLGLHPAHGDTAGSIFLSAARQLTVGDGRGAERVFPKFDWENRICVKLDFTDLCKVLQVLRGESESIDDGRGLFHRHGGVSTAIKFRHIVEPENAYSLEMYRSSGRGAADCATHILFSSAEALGLCEVISRILPVVCFGEAQPRGQGGRDEAAA